MKRSKKQRTPHDATETSYTFWKDVGFLGCVISGIVFGLIVLALLAPDSGIPKVQEVLRIKRQLERDIKHLEAENEKLDQEIQAMHTDPFWQEKIAREELNMALPGEIIYKFAE
jgi:cell division protein FtsB